MRGASRLGGAHDPARWRYALVAVGTIVAGLVVHLRGSMLTPVVRDVAGDALWAMLIVWIASALVPRLALPVRAGAALAVCFAVETSQLWRAPWLDAVRRTVPGHLVLGSDLDPRDFLAYALGVLVATTIAYVVLE